MLEWLIVPGYFGVSFAAYKIMHHFDFKDQYNWHLTEVTRHGCKHTHPETSHEKWSYDMATADRDPKDFSAASFIWPIVIIWTLVEFTGKMIAALPTGRKINKQVESAEARFQLEQFAEREGLPWNQER